MTMELVISISALFLSGVAVLLWYTHVRIPEGFSEPLKFRYQLAIRELRLLYYWILHLLGILPYEQSLRLHKQRTAPVPYNISIKEDIFNGVRVRLYKRRDAGEGARPGLVFYHGGGWIFLSPKHYDPLILAILEDLDIIVVSVQYRLSPEVVFPGPLMDCYHATKYFMSNAHEFGVDSKKISFCGDSAGGNMAMGVSMKFRDEHFSPRPKLQMLICPVAQGLDFSLPSHVQNRNGPILPRHFITYMISMYACGSGKYAPAMARNTHISAEAKLRLASTYIRHDKLPPSNRTTPYQGPDLGREDKSTWEELKDVLENPFFSPLVATDLSGLPDTCVYTGQYDVLRNEGHLLAGRLREAGVKVHQINGEKGFHGMTVMPKFYAETRSFLAEIVQYLGVHAM